MKLGNLKKSLPLILLAMAVPGSRAQSWTNIYRGTSSSIGFAIAADKDGNVCVTGNSAGPCATIKYSAAGVALWTNIYSAGLSDFTHAITADSAGNWYVTGYSFGSSQDYVTIKYSANGSPVWTNRYNGPGDGVDDAYAIAVDSGGNAYVTGYSTGTNGHYEYATIKYSPAGAPVWTNRYNGPGNGTNFGRALALDAGGNVFVTGFAVGSNGQYNSATIKYLSSGAAAWTNLYTASGIGSALMDAIAVDSGGNVYVTGEGTSSRGDYDFTTIKYSTSGAQLWVKTYNGPGNTNDSGNAITLDSSGNVYVTGTSIGVGTGNDYVTLAYSSTGTPLWTNRYNGAANDDDQPFAIAADAAGNVYLTGYSTTAPGTNAFTTLAYSKAGAPLWTNIYDGHGSSFSRAFGLAVDGNGNVFVEGESVLSTGRSYITIKYAGPASFAIATGNGNFGFLNGHFGFDVSGPADSTIVIQASTDLHSWVPLQTNILNGGTLHFSDPQSSRSGARFYRAAIQSP